MTFITDYKLDNNKGQRRSLKIIQKEEEKRGRLMTKFGISDRRASLLLEGQLEIERRFKELEKMKEKK